MPRVATRIHQTETYKGKRGTVYYVRWAVDGKRRKKPFKNAALAESFRSELVSAARRGEAFDTEFGLPVSMQRTAREMSWYGFACAYVDLKWPRVAATTRRTHAEAFTAVTMLMFATDRGKPDSKLLRAALCRWAFNTVMRDDESRSTEVRSALRWAAAHTRSVSALGKPEILRAVLDGLTVRLDGKPAAPSVVSRRRKILNAAVEYAIELQLLQANPIPALKWTAPKTVHAVDRRSVANPVQARTLLAAVRTRFRGRLVAFFGCLYFAAMRPEEAVSLRKRNLALPTEGWGEFHLDAAEPHAGKEWTDSGENRDRRQLKQRARGETRTVPCPPELTALIRAHVDRFGYGPDGRLFAGERNKTELPKGTINRVWREARQEVFTPEVAASPLAATPYDLRHAAVSTWLNGGVPPTQVAEWAGHSVEILLKIYAKCLDGGGELLRQRIQEALGHQVAAPPQTSRPAGGTPEDRDRAA
jgi:integrase